MKPAAYCQGPKRPSKPLDGMVGAAPLSRPVLAVWLCESAFASCRAGAGCGLAAVALPALAVALLAVLASAGRGSDLGRIAPTAAVCVGLAAVGEAAGFVFGAEAAGWLRVSAV
jgi:hypothetical protein